ncbi:MAG TPA: hypothetical protein PKH10_02105 [bacterium]|nr:hypothetical protein [bacterium]
MIICNLVHYLFPEWYANGLFFLFSFLLGIPLIIIWFAMARKRILKDWRFRLYSGLFSVLYIISLIFIPEGSGNSTAGIGVAASIIDMPIIDVAIYLVIRFFAEPEEPKSGQP